MKNNLIKLTYLLGLSFLYLFSTSTSAAVIMNGSRVIMTGKPEKTIEFTNTGKTPYLVQVSSEDKDKNDLIAIPPIFKINPTSGQTVRLSLAPVNHVNDRETLHYMTFTQYPSVDAAKSDHSKLSVIIKSTVKVIYRPALIEPLNSSVEKQLRFRTEGNSLIIENQSPHVISLKEVKEDGKTLGEKLTILPYDHTALNVNHRIKSKQLNAVMINDYGVEVNIIVSH